MISQFAILLPLGPTEKRQEAPQCYFDIHDGNGATAAADAAEDGCDVTFTTKVGDKNQRHTETGQWFVLLL